MTALREAHMPRKLPSAKRATLAKNHRLKESLELPKESKKSQITLAVSTQHLVLRFDF
jgi:hypothetical protein